jgi:hypothetical protein
MRVRPFTGTSPRSAALTRRVGGAGCACGLSQELLQAFLLEQLDHLFDGGFVAAVGDQDGVSILNDKQVVDADGGDQAVGIADDDAAARVESRPAC